LDRIPLVDLGSLHAPLREEIEAAIAGVIDSGEFVLGPDVDRFEAEFASHCEAEHCVGVASGTAALRLAYEALGIGPGDEVIAPANTFIATVLPILELGARPVLVDVDPATALIDPEAVPSALTPRTRAIVPVHLYGQPADLAPILELAEDRDIAVVEDAAQAHGARYGRRRVGGLGRLGCFSFYPAKNLGALGDAGAVVTNDGELAQRIRLLRNLGESPKHHHETRGHNERLDTMQAAVLRVKLRRLDGWNEARRAVARAYGAALAGLPLRLPVEAAGREHVWHLYVVRSPDRDALHAALRAVGVGVGMHYPVPLHLQPALAGLGYAAGNFPVAEAWAAELLSLPMHPALSEEAIGTVSATIERALSARVD
jgi:dTDP-4-amino-4,6-dideoxygalactose transaminase